MLILCHADDATLVSHVCKIHRHGPNFLIYCSRCLRSFRVWDTYKKHRYRGCRDNATNCVGDDEGAIEYEDNTIDFLEEGNSEPCKSNFIDL